MLAEFYPLMRIVFPDDDFKAQEELFYRASRRYGFAGKPGRRCEVLSFDTWMNLFASKKWYTYCSLGDLYLEIEAKGECEVIVTGHCLNSAFGVISETIQSIFCDFGEEPCKQKFLIGDVKNYDGVSFEISMPEHGHSEFYGAAWGTDHTSMRKHTLAIVTCTFKRERYIRKTMQKFADFLQENPALRERIHLYVVDNGRTLEDNGQEENISIIPNKNAGGAGGFGRGLMCANDEGYTRCLFMDDDVEIVPETFYRTLVLIDYFKDEYKDAFVNGPMMNLYDKYVCFENLSVRSGLWLHGYHQNCPVKDSFGIMKCITVDESVFEKDFTSAAWWYACFSMDLYRNEYPIPCFLRGDDAEWSWRHRGIQHISMNGVCIWHAPFEWRVGRVADYYYLPRNMFFLHSVYNENFQDEYMGYFHNIFHHLMNTYDYVSMELFLLALSDIRKGGRAFCDDPEMEMKKIKKVCQKAQVMPCNDINEMELAKLYDDRLINEEIGIAMECGTADRDFIGKKKVKVYNLLKKTYEIREYNKAKEIKMRDQFFGLMHLIENEYEELVDDLKKSHATLTSRSFWNKYLELEEEV